MCSNVIVQLGLTQLNLIASSVIMYQKKLANNLFCFFTKAKHCHTIILILVRTLELRGRVMIILIFKDLHFMPEIRSIQSCGWDSISDCEFVVSKTIDVFDDITLTSVLFYFFLVTTLCFHIMETIIYIHHCMSSSCKVMYSLVTSFRYNCM
jgi:hypothetical protein